MDRVKISRSNGQPIYQQIAEQIRSKILEGSLKAGYKLPAERKLAALLDVDRITVTAAYRELKKQGLISTIPTKGTIVIDRTDIWLEASPETSKAKRLNWDVVIANAPSRLRDASDEEIVEVINRRDIISLVGRWTSFSGFWTNEFPLPAEMQRDLEDHPNDLEIVSPIEGLLSFREAISQMMFDGSGYCGSEDMVVTRGGRHGLDIVAHSLVNRDDLVVCEEPTYNWASLSFRKLGAQMVGVPMTPYGMDLDILEHTLKRRHIKFIYTMPTTQNPCGITTDLKHRTRLLDIAERYMVPIVEDDPYWGLGYTSSETMPTLRSMDRCDSVIYVGTLSKAVTPRLELGWICAPREIVRLAKTMLGYTMLNSNTHSQLMTQRFIENGRIWTHIDRMREIDQQDDSVFRSVMQECDVPGVSWFENANGPFRTITLPPGVSAIELAKVAGRNGVAVMPGKYYSVTPEKADSFIRISLRHVPHDQIVKGLRILIDSIRQLSESIGEDALLRVTPAKAQGYGRKAQ